MQLTPANKAFGTGCKACISRNEHCSEFFRVISVQVHLSCDFVDLLAYIYFIFLEHIPILLDK